jgi:hypothetical protein
MTLLDIIKSIPIKDKKRAKINNTDSLVSRITEELKTIGLSNEKCLSQSLYISLGNYLEKAINIYAKTNINLIVINTKIKKGEHQLDFYAKNRKDKLIFYVEIKSNINLDTEKTKGTIRKINDVIEDLSSKNKQKKYKVNGGLLALKYLYKTEIPNHFKTKYKNINLFGLNDFLDLIGVKKLTNKEYDKCLLTLIKRLKENNY